MDYNEIRKLVEDSIDYLYNNIPDDAAAQGEGGEILALERSLRGQYVDPALELYKTQLKRASLEFYKSIEDIIRPIVNPFVGKANGGTEIIISLPQESLQ